MTGASGLKHETVIEHLREWLHRNLSGCSFAAHLGQKRDRIGYGVASSLTTRVALETLEYSIDLFASNGMVTVWIWPDMHTPTDLAKLLSALRVRPRWSLASVPGASPLTHRTSVAVSLRWSTAAGLTSSAMGLAPFGIMPVMRRTPYVCLVVWGGGHANELRPKPKEGDDPNEVGLIDIPTDFDRAQHRAAMKSTSAKTRELAGADPAVLRDVAFMLPTPITRQYLPSLARAPR